MGSPDTQNAFASLSLKAIEMELKGISLRQNPFGVNTNSAAVTTYESPQPFIDEEHEAWEDDLQFIEEYV